MILGWWDQVICQGNSGGC